MTSTQRCPICKSELRKARKTEFHYGGTVFENFKKGGRALSLVKNILGAKIHIFKHCVQEFVVVVVKPFSVE